MAKLTIEIEDTAHTRLALKYLADNVISAEIAFWEHEVAVEPEACKQQAEAFKQIQENIEVALEQALRSAG
jgi:hypothetical protein